MQLQNPYQIKEINKKTNVAVKKTKAEEKNTIIFDLAQTRSHVHSLNHHNMPLSLQQATSLLS